ncbi:MAG TPA: argininosuccinate lyase [Synergistaceae bacterium]|nr:argininosuccinate lyase [Synergistaceae bacterium]
MWKGRFTGQTAQIVQRFTQSLDLDWRLAAYDIRGSIAHARMLRSVGLLTDDEERRIETGLLEIGTEIASGTLVPTQELEDVHMNIESRLIEKIGPAGAKLHTGRSRNDQVAVTVRLFLRDQLLGMAEDMEALLSALLRLAERHRLTVIPGYTHLQQAQPVSFGHYLMAHFTAFSRDYDRLFYALRSLNECPLGAGALAGSTLPLDRHFTAAELGFPSPTRNSLDTVAQRDYMLDYHSFASLFAVHCSRLCEDFILYSSQEFGWLLLPDSFCTGSSMMPQKKNADVLELLRGKTGQIVGHQMDLYVTLKGLPMTYDRDLQEDKRGLWASLATVSDMIHALTALLCEVDVNEERAAAGMADGLILATDVAEELVRRGIPFREAHEKVGHLVKECLARGKGLFDLSREEWAELLPELDGDLLGNLSIHAAVERRKTFGGTGFDQVAEQIRYGVAAVEEAKERRERYAADLPVIE